VPPLGRVDVRTSGLALLAGGFGELGACGEQRMLEERTARLDALGEAGGELVLLQGERRADERGQDGGVVGVGADPRDLLEL
jgi:hypothetical protein